MSTEVSEKTKRPTAIAARTVSTSRAPASSAALWLVMIHCRRFRASAR